MRSQVLSAFTGALGLAAMVATAPAPSYYGNGTCGDRVSTVYVTGPAVSTTTVDSGQPTTVYVTVPPLSTLILGGEGATAVPTDTQTLYSTRTSTITSRNGATVYPSYGAPIYSTHISISASQSAETPYASFGEPLSLIETDQIAAVGAAPTSSSLQYDGTVTEVDIVTITTGLVPSGSSGSEGALPAPTTLDTSQIEYTTTIKNTISTSSETTVTKTLPASPSISGLAVKCSGVRSGGWNATSTNGITGSENTQAISGQATISTGTAQTPFDLFPTSNDIISITSLAAKSGFNVYTTPTEVSTADGEYTTAVIDGQTVSWGGTDTYATAQSVSSPGSTVDSSESSIPFTFSIPSVTLQLESETVVSSTLANPTPLASSTLATLPSSRFSNSTTDGGLTASATSNSIASSSIFTASVPSETSAAVVATSSFTANQTATSASLIASNQGLTSVSSASATPTLCGEHGDFTLNFDDIPPLAIGNQSVNDVQPAPVFNPYHQFAFTDGFVVVPPPTDPYLPSSPPLLLEFIPNFNVDGTNPNAGPNTGEEGYSGDIEDGDFGATGCFHFNFYGASFGCDSHGPLCIFTFTGFRLDNTTRETTTVVSKQYSVPACPSLKKCDLTLVTVDDTFRDLTSIRLNVTVGSDPKIWWMDDLQLGWTDNSCVAIHEKVCIEGARVEVVDT
ncbi:hypothetical protein B7494_g7471 [Chlorociboria aeruginascens]|nr:hypothetical protein B7494_g7471 [Chlorociboria aeruginascens]